MRSSVKNRYVRVGTVYYKYVEWPLISGDKVRKLVHWNKETIKFDHGKNALSQITCYDGFCNIPDHIDYKEDHNGFLNLYKPIPFIPKEGPFPNTETFLTHIFQDQLDIGMDYLTILYRYPIQVLPILCLVSKERKTGKTTFLDFLKYIFSENMTYNKNEDFRSEFNSDWSGKLLICVDEVLLDRVEDSERIKNLATASTFKSQAKFKDRVESEFFGKFVLCSNNEDSFIQIDPGETRYWVRRVPTFEKEDVNLKKQLKKEIPAFLFHLLSRDIMHPRMTRMWFNESLLKTDALKRVIHRNQTRLHIEIIEVLNGIVEDFELDEVNMCLKDLLPYLKQASIRSSRSEIKQLFEEEWELEKQANSHTYTRYDLVGGSIIGIPQQKGRYYTITKEFILQKLKER